MIIREAFITDLDAVSRIYSDIHTAEETGACTIGWQRDIYPTKKTAEDAILRGDLFVMEEDETGEKAGCGAGSIIVGAAIINRIQVDVYAGAPWEFDTDRVCVLHTLVISPKAAGRGYGTAFVRSMSAGPWSTDFRS